MDWNFGKKEKLARFLLLFFVFGFVACTGSNSETAAGKGGFTDETETLASGTVRDSLGNPVPACSVWVHPLSSHQATALAKVQLKVDSTRKSYGLLTDSSGEFAFVGLTPGLYSLVAVQAERSIGIKTNFQIEQQDTLTLLENHSMRRVEQLTIPLDAFRGDTILIPELGILWPVTEDTLRVRSIPAGTYEILRTGEESTVIMTLTTETLPDGPILSWNDEHTQAIITDWRDSSIYPVIIYGNLVWFSQNLRFKTATSSCNPNDPYATTNCDAYGRFYSWEEAQNACPAGWFLPSAEDWLGLVEGIGGRSVAGSHLKAQQGWNSGISDDAILFSVQPTGSASSPTLGTDAYFWTSTALGNMIQVVNFSAGTDSVGIDGYAEQNQMSVRCVAKIKE